MISMRDLVRDGNSVWVSGSLLPFTSERLETAVHRFVCAGHDKLVIDFRRCADLSDEQIAAAHRLALTALRGRVRVMFLAAPAEGRRLQRSGLNTLVSLLTVGEDWQKDETPATQPVAAD